MRWLALLFALLLLLSPGVGVRGAGAAGLRYIVVLGAAQYNGKPSPIFKNRLEAALGLYRQGAAPAVVVTGGRQPGDRYSEGEVGCNYLRLRGVPSEALACEQRSRSTWQNLANILPLVKGQPILIVTDEPHLPRALLLAERLGLKAQGFAVKGNFSQAYYQRETVLTLLAHMGITDAYSDRGK
ncbi:YdcF family protein [Calidithermus chliarophilus]|uniref:YdcF family protein n=1 Tax=Calidithermus chliarophilus TaxID=52023 RepID=UPI0003FCC7E9|nr:YdcF family protein [Calidithermus chliarophilus]